jgi:hypothetical protein
VARDLAPWVALIAAAIGFAVYLVARARRIAAEQRGQTAAEQRRQNRSDGPWHQQARDGAVVTVDRCSLGWEIRCSRDCAIPESWFGAPGEREATVIFGRKHVRHHDEGRAGRG